MTKGFGFGYFNFKDVVGYLLICKIDVIFLWW